MVSRKYKVYFRMHNSEVYLYIFADCKSEAIDKLNYRATKHNIAVEFIKAVDMCPLYGDMSNYYN